MQRVLSVAAALAMLGTAVAGAACAQAQTPGASPSAAAGARPAEDVARDAFRKPAEMVAFAGVRPGDRVGDLIPGGGYFTRVFARAAGPRGVVYALVPAAFAKAHPQAVTSLQTLAAAPGYGNVRLVAFGPGSMPPEPLDVVWTSQNYHDLHNAPAGTVEAMNRAVFAMLKPGGRYVVLDHAAAAGSGVRDTGTLHRIDPAVVKAEVTAAGFVFDGENDSVRNPADLHTAKVFDPAIRGRTDQFVYRFRKPAA